MGIFGRDDKDVRVKPAVPVKPIQQKPIQAPPKNNPQSLSNLIKLYDTLKKEKNVDRIIALLTPIRDEIVGRSRGGKMLSPKDKAVEVKKQIGYIYKMIAQLINALNKFEEQANYNAFADNAKKTAFLGEISKTKASLGKAIKQLGEAEKALNPIADGTLAVNKIPANFTKCDTVIVKVTQLIQTEIKAENRLEHMGTLLGI